MKIKLHHLNLCSKDVPGMEEFYRSVLDLDPEPSLNGARDTTQGYAAPVAFVTDGQTQVHLATRDLGVGFRTKHIVNPLERGHIAFRTDDIAAFTIRINQDCATERQARPAEWHFSVIARSEATRRSRSRRARTT